MDGRTAEEVIADAVEEVVGFADGGTRAVSEHVAADILAALADAGLVVCADGEANRAGEKVRVERATVPDFDTDANEAGAADLELWLHVEDDNYDLHLGPAPVGSFALYRLVPLDGGEP